MAANTAEHEPDLALERELAQLKAQYEKLRDEKVRAEETLKHLQAELASLEERARAEYGTADPGELAAKLEDMRTQNAKLVSDYRAHIHSVRESLARLDHGGND